MAATPIADYDAILLKQLKKRNSGVIVTQEVYPSIEVRNYYSLFEALSLYAGHGVGKRRLTFSTQQREALFKAKLRSNGEDDRLEELKLSSESPCDFILREAEVYFSVSINVYILEFYRDSFRSVLVRDGEHKGKPAFNVVLLSGRYLYINNLDQFLHISRERHQSVQNNPRLKWILDHKHIRTLVRSDDKKKLNSDDLVFFRCLALHRQTSNLEAETRSLHQQYFKAHPDPIDQGRFHCEDPGVRNPGEGFNGRNIYAELDKLEFEFKIQINIYRLGQEDVEGDIFPSIVRLSSADEYTDTLHLLAYETDLYYVSDIKYLSQHISCSKCGKALPNKHFKTHFTRCRGAQTTTTFHRKTYSIPRTLAQECQLRGVVLPEDLEFRKYVITWDIETYTKSLEAGEREEREEWEEGIETPIVVENADRVTLSDLDALIDLLNESDEKSSQSAPASNDQTSPDDIEKLNSIKGRSHTQYSQPHTLLSIAVASNVPNFQDVRVFISEGDSGALVKQFMDYCGEIQIAAAEEIANQVRCVVKQLSRIESPEKSDLWEELDTALDQRLQERLRKLALNGGEIDDHEDREDNDGSDDESDLLFGALTFDEEGLKVEDNLGEKSKKVTLPSRPNRSVSTLIGRLVSVCRSIPIISFNGASFDENCIAKYLLPYFHSNPKLRKRPAKSDDHLLKQFFPAPKRKNVGRQGGAPKRQCQDEQDVDEIERVDGDVVIDVGENKDGWQNTTPNVLKKGNKYLLLSNDRFRFLDICFFNAAGTSYAKYLQGYDCKEEKIPFPYDWIKSLKQLDHPCLPTQDEFFNSLKQKECTDEEYAICTTLWKEHKMTCFRDYLRLYNSMDVLPFVEALEKQRSWFQRERKLHLFDFVSIPGVTDHILHNTAPKGTWFSTISKRDEDLHHSLDRALQGGKKSLLLI